MKKMLVLGYILISIFIDFRVYGASTCNNSEAATGSCLLKDFDPWTVLLDNLDPQWSFSAIYGIIHPYGAGDNVPGLSVPVLMINNGPVFIAAELGQGRVAVAAHTKFLTNFHTNSANSNDNMEQFHSNIRNWLTRDDFTDISQICRITSLETAADCLNSPNVKIIVQDGTKAFNSSSLDADMLNFVENGGGVFMGLTPWWMGNLANIPFYQSLYHKAGILISTRYGYISGEGFDTVLSEEDKEALRMENIAYAIDRTSGINDDMLAHETTLKNGIVLAVDKTIDFTPQVVKDVLVQKYTELADAIDWDDLQYPTSTTKVVSTQGYSGLLLKLADRLARVNYPRFSKIPGIDYWPGDVPSDEPRITREVTFTSHIKDMFSSGLFHAAGSELQIQVISDDSDYSTWKLRISSFADRVYNKASIKRWPTTSVTDKIRSRNFNIYDPYGGIIYLESPSSPSNITIRFYDVIDAVPFDFSVESTERWETIKNSNVPIIDIHGANVTFIGPRHKLRAVTLEELTSALHTWDTAMVNCNNLRGTDVSKIRHMYVSDDLDIRYGSAHAGYPFHVMSKANGLGLFFSWYSGFFIRVATAPANFWGLLHEFGHMYERNDWKTREVTVNIFTLYNMELLAGIEPWSHPKFTGIHSEAADQIVSVPVSQRLSKYNSLGNTQKLIMYAQLQYHFGWDCYKQVFRWYEDGRVGTIGGNAKIKTWVKQWSYATGYNLVPMFEFWGWSVNDDVKTQLSSMTSFMPNDETLISDAAIAEANRLSTEYGSTRDLGDQVFCVNWDN